MRRDLLFCPAEQAPKVAPGRIAVGEGPAGKARCGRFRPARSCRPASSGLFYSQGWRYETRRTPPAISVRVWQAKPWWNTLFYTPASGIGRGAVWRHLRLTAAFRHAHNATALRVVSKPLPIAIRINSPSANFFHIQESFNLIKYVTAFFLQAL